MESRHRGLEKPGRWGMGKPSQVRRGLEGGGNVGWVGCASFNINHRGGEQLCWEPASPCRGQQRGRDEWG